LASRFHIVTIDGGYRAWSPPKDNMFCREGNFRRLYSSVSSLRRLPVVSPYNPIKTISDKNLWQKFSVISLFNTPEVLTDPNSKPTAGSESKPK
jgi:hypothetical protein